MDGSGSDVLVVGGGIVGLATAWRLLEARPALRLTLVEKEPEVATHQTGRNSGVIHSPNTYAPGSLKARLCGEGREAAIAFADEHAIPYELCGELIVATREEELPRLETIRQRALQNGSDLHQLGPEEITDVEPAVMGLRALHVTSTGIIDWGLFARVLAAQIRERGGDVRTEAEVTGIRRLADGMAVETTAGAFRTRNLVTCAGLHSDRIAAMTGDAADLRIVPFRGDYAVLRPEARHLCRTLIYPVADPRFPFLGVHLTRRIDGEVWAGPNAVLAFGRESYRRRDVAPRELRETLAWPGFQRLAFRYWRMGGMEMVRDASRRLFLRALQAYTPAITLDDIAWGPAGIRAQAVRRNGTLVEDFVIGGRDRVLHVQNAPSPAATASLAIGRELAGMAIERFGL